MVLYIVYGIRDIRVQRQLAYTTSQTAHINLRPVHLITQEGAIIVHFGQRTLDKPTSTVLFLYFFLDSLCPITMITTPFDTQVSS